MQQKPGNSIISLGDLSEYRSGLNNFAGGRWDEDRWKTFRLRFGIYAQRQSDAYMVRSKIPGGRLSFSQARTAAWANAEYGGPDIHITTRQDFQFYFIRLEQTPAFLKILYNGGLSTREASGNTFRNVVACPLAGFCPHELVDAGEVAQSLSQNWIRHPLVQHMPRKFKTTVSGCAHDCGASAIDDLGFIATTRGGLNGFKVVAGGGLGNRPHTAIVVEEFVLPEELSAVQEAFARLHHAQSNRENKNASRIKFLVDRFGEEGFVALFKEQFERIQKLNRKKPLDFQWRTPTAEGQPPSVRDGIIAQHDGRIAIVIRPPLGMIDSQRLFTMSDIAEALGAEEFILTRDQNILAVGLPEESRALFVAQIRELGFEAGVQSDALSDMVSCPGTSTCPIGITNSNALAAEINADRESFAELRDATIRISGCHNSCGQHHIGDFGLHALAKKINGKSAPHYQFHVGGDGTRKDAIGIPGPVVPARLAKPALKTLMSHYADSRKNGENTRTWVKRVGSDHIAEILSAYSAECYDADNPDLLLDVGSDDRFFPPLTATGECAASAVVGEYLSDLAETALQDISRFALAGERSDALEAGRDAVSFTIRRLLLVVEADHKGLEYGELLDAFQAHFSGNPHVVSALNLALGALVDTGQNISVEPVRKWINAAGDLAETLIPGAMPVMVPA
ncbi:MAG: nitrite/sulfite reductase [Rhodospirillales bacterium]|nr:nitrite/sulfite reductase [Rhodospirillales bacterium]